MKARNYYLLFLGLLVAFLTMDYFSNQKMIQLRPISSVDKNEVKADFKATPLKSSEPISSVNTEKVETEEAPMDSVQQFKSEFKYEVAQVGQIQTDADAVENRLQAMARQMEPEHKGYLKLILNTDQIGGDERAMAIELLSRNQTQEAAEILKNFTMLDTSGRDLKSDQELVFKAQAIEGLAGYQDRNVALSYLNEISQKTNDSFLQDRVRRAQTSLKNEGPAIETQDLEALKKIVN